MFSSEANPTKAAVYLLAAGLLAQDTQSGRFPPAKGYMLSMELAGRGFEELGKMYPPEAA